MIWTREGTSVRSEDTDEDDSCSLANYLVMVRISFDLE